MEENINGERYDTSLDLYIKGFLFEGWRGYWWSEKLYCRSDGEFYLFGEGAETSGYPYGEIIPLTIDKAKEWLKCHNFIEKYNEVFGEDEDFEKTSNCIKEYIKSTYVFDD